jgi:predicted nucleic acid-binding protein
LIVVDASVVLELLLNTAAAPAIARRLLKPTQTMHAPHLLDLEIAQVLRRYVLSGEMDADRAHMAMLDLLDLPIHRYPHHVWLPRVWELRSNLTAYDAAYVSLAESLRAPLLTRDERMARASGHSAKVEVV